MTWHSQTSVVILCSEKSVTDPLVGTVFIPHHLPWRVGQIPGWLRLFPNSLRTLVAHYLGILSWKPSLFLVWCSRGPLKNSHVPLPCSLWILHRLLTDILQTWWFKICKHVTPLIHTSAILPSSICNLSPYFPHMGRMDWSGTHMPQYTSPISCRIVVRCIVGHPTSFVSEHIGAVSTFCSWWHTFDISWAIP